MTDDTIITTRIEAQTLATTLDIIQTLADEAKFHSPPMA